MLVKDRNVLNTKFLAEFANNLSAIGMISTSYATAIENPVKALCSIKR